MRFASGKSLAFAAAALLGTAAQAEDITVKLGVLTDMSSLYADDTAARAPYSPPKWRCRTSTPRPTA